MDPNGRDRYRVGIIGTGRIASAIQDEVEHGPFHFMLPYSHAGAYAALAKFQLVAAADPNDERRQAFAQRWSVPAIYADYREMLERERLDIVSICTPTRSHLSIALDVAAAGVVGVFLEKPVAQSLRDTDRMIDAFAAGGVWSVVNHIRTFDPYYRRVRELIAGGAVGDLHSVMVHWREGMLFGGTHLFDTLRFLIGSDATWVFGHLDAGDGQFDLGGSGIVGFANGVEVFINNRAGHSAPSEFDIVGTQGRIRIGNALFPELYVKDAQSQYGDLSQRVFPGSVTAKSAMTIAVEELVRAIETGAKPASDLRDGRADLELAVAFHKSHESHTPVQLPITDLDYVIEDPWGRS